MGRDLGWMSHSPKQMMQNVTKPHSSSDKLMDPIPCSVNRQGMHMCLPFSPMSRLHLLEVPHVAKPLCHGTTKHQAGQAEDWQIGLSVALLASQLGKGRF